MSDPILLICVFEGEECYRVEWDDADPAGWRNAVDEARAHHADVHPDIAPGWPIA